MLWLKSRNSEVWLDRRTNYTRSAAVMSMVGYILGLGDRHPSNLMLDRWAAAAAAGEGGGDAVVHMSGRGPEGNGFRVWCISRGGCARGGGVLLTCVLPSLARAGQAGWWAES